MFITLPLAQIVNDPAPQVSQGTGAIVQMCRVQFMGGEMRCPNPSKVPNGQYQDARVEITVAAQAKEWKARDGRSGALLSLAVQPVQLLGVAKK